MQTFFFFFGLHLRKHRILTIAFTLILTLISLIFNTSMSLLGDYDTCFDNEMEQYNVPDLYISLANPNDDCLPQDFLNTHIENNSAVSHWYYTSNMVADSVSYTLGEDSSTHDMLITNLDHEKNMAVADISICEEDPSLAKKGIYLSELLKDEKNIQIGDVLSFTIGDNILSYPVAGFVDTISLHYEPGQISNLYFHSENYQLFCDSVKESVSVQYGLHLYLEEKSNKEDFSFTLSRAYLDTYGKNIQIFTYNEFKNLRTFIPKTLSLFLLLPCLCISLICAILFYFQIETSTLQSLQEYGLLKSLGYQNKEIYAYFSFPYLLLSSISILFGFLLSCAILMNLYPLFNYPLFKTISWKFNLGTFIVRYLLLIFVVQIIVFFASKQLQKIPGITALRGGIVSHHFTRFRLPLHKSPGSSFFLFRLKGYFHFGRQNFLLFLLAAYFVLDISFSAIFIQNAMIKPENFVDTLFVNVADIELHIHETTDSDAILTSLRKDSDISLAYYFDTTSIAVGSETFTCYISDDFDKLVSPHCYEGRTPIHPNEVALGGIIAEKLNKKIGDEIEISIYDKKQTFLVTGLVQSGDTGCNAELTTAGIRRLISNYKPASVYLLLKGKPTPQAIENKIAELTSTYEEKINSYNNHRATADSLLRSYQRIICLIITVTTIFLVVTSALILYIIVKNRILQQQHSFSLLHAIGYTKFQILVHFITDFVPPITAGALVMAVLFYFFHDAILTPLFRLVGIIQLNFSYPLPVSILCLCLSLFSCFLIVFIMAKFHFRKKAHENYLYNIK